MSRHAMFCAFFLSSFLFVDRIVDLEPESEGKGIQDRKGYASSLRAPKISSLIDIDVAYDTRYPKLLRVVLDQRKVAFDISHERFC